MIVVIVRDNQQVDFRHAFSAPRILPGKGFIQKRERRGIVAEHRVNQDAFARELQVPGGVTKPHQGVLLQRQARKIGFHQRQRLGRARVFGFFGQKIPRRDQHIFVAVIARRRQRIVEFPVAILGRGLHFSELLTLRRLAESGIQYKR